MRKLTPRDVRSFRNVVWRHSKTLGRHALPWRLTKDPYHILVSEIMLQQTQVERVIPYYKAWMRKFPTLKALASAPLFEVLTLWQGLGYNRRARNLHMAAKELSLMRTFPTTPQALERLPGIGPYTARAVGAFAFNADTVFVETNIRTVITHHFFPKKQKVADTEILNVLNQVYPKGKAREWYGALMDYGAHLKRSGMRLNSRAKGYTKQTTFKGSAREARGAILKALVESPRTSVFLIDLLGPSRREQVKSQIASLLKEGLITLSKGKVELPK